MAALVGLDNLTGYYVTCSVVHGGAHPSYGMNVDPGTGTWASLGRTCSWDDDTKISPS